jgi:hypothetical protein
MRRAVLAVAVALAFGLACTLGRAGGPESATATRR